MRARVKIVRIDQHPLATLGRCFVYDETSRLIFECCTLELPWKNNEKGHSRIPEGKYPGLFEHSNRFRKKLWELYQVPGRTEVKFHVANYARQLEGCIAVGNKHIDIDGDTVPDVTSSGPTLALFHKALKPWEGQKIDFEFIDLYYIP